MSFKTQAKIYQALLDGKTLTNNNGNQVRLEKGTQNSRSNSEYDFSPTNNSWSFDDPKEWSLGTEPKSSMVIWVNVSEDNVPGCYNLQTKEEAEKERYAGHRTVRFVESPEESYEK